PAWGRAQLGLACARFKKIFGEAPHVHGAAGWQMTGDALRWLDEQHFKWASDGRGQGPFRPLLGDHPARCLQLPTTLPTLDELIGLEGVDVSTVASKLLALTQEDPPLGHVFTLHAELEGQRLRPVFQELLRGWKTQGYQLVSLAQMASAMEFHPLPSCPMIQGSLPGRSGTLALQGTAR
ncbi:polysaccharide deacetylase family protein, partial [mine drainage metagenome]